MRPPKYAGGGFAATRQSQLGTIIFDGQADIISGRKPVASWDDVLRNWRTTGGDKVRSEFEEAIQRGEGGNVAGK